MLNKQQRLTKFNAFVATYKQKKIVADENIILYGGKNKTLKDQPTRVGFVVSKKISKLAVKRNKIKRYLRESYKTFLKSEQSELSQKFQSLIFMANNQALNKTHKELEQSLFSLLIKLSSKN